MKFYDLLNHFVFIVETMPGMPMSKRVLVTGGNSGIGLALCKLLIRDHDCYVYLGSRDASRGATALKSIIEEVPEKADKIEVIQIDVGNDASCKSAAEALKGRGEEFNI